MGNEAKERESLILHASATAQFVFHRRIAREFSGIFESSFMYYTYSLYFIDLF